MIKHFIHFLWYKVCTSMLSSIKWKLTCEWWNTWDGRIPLHQHQCMGSCWGECRQKGPLPTVGHARCSGVHPEMPDSSNSHLFPSWSKSWSALTHFKFSKLILWISQISTKKLPSKDVDRHYPFPAPTLLGIFIESDKK